VNLVSTVVVIDNVGYVLSDVANHKFRDSFWECFSKRLLIVLIVWRITIVRIFFMPNYILQFYCRKRSGYVAEIATEFIVLSSIWWLCCHFPCEWFFFGMNNMKYSVLTTRSLVTSLIVQGSTHALCFKLFDIFS
jgi:hypothetical protein